jgi:cytosine/adenosine deaminase-related metal-dependent hydrolase
MPFTLRARWILPVDQPPIADGYVAIDGGRIRAVGSQPPDCGVVEDLGDAVLMPGLVNAHTHLEFSGIAEPLGKPRVSLPTWIRLVIGDRRRGDRDVGAAIAAGLRESLSCGVTTIGEIATSPAALYVGEDPKPAVVQFQEAIGFSAGRVDSVFSDLEQRLESAAAPAGLSPHAPYTVHPRLLQRIVDLAKSRRVPIAMHLAESLEELQLLETGDGPFRELLEERSMWDAEAIPHRWRPLDYLRMLAAAPRSLIIHGNYLMADEIEFLGRHGDPMSVVYCPRTHEYFRNTPYPLQTMLAAGVRIALGTDSRASNPDLDLLAELRHISNTMPGVMPEQLVRMATLSGAEALGLAGETGSLSQGKRADIIALPCDADSSNPYHCLLSSERPRRVWLAGREVSGPLR